MTKPYIIPASAPSDRPLNTLGEIKTALSSTGSYFFEPDTLRFFNSRASENVYPTPYGTFFVTSERDSGDPRMYTVRFIAATAVQTPREWNDGEVQMITHKRLDLADTSINAFRRYASGSGAHKAARSMQRQLQQSSVGTALEVEESEA